MERAREPLEFGEADRVVFFFFFFFFLLLDAQVHRGRAREALTLAHDRVRTAPLRERRWELLALAQ